MRSALAALSALLLIVALGSPARADDPTGSITGTITTSTGEPAHFAHVSLMYASGVGGPEKLTGPDGTYRFDGLRPGQYKISVGTGGSGGPRQYAHQKLTFAEADAFTVEGGKETVVDERMLEPGALEVKVVDSASGAPAENVCVSLHGQGPDRCAADTGEVRWDGLGGKSDYAMDVRASDGLHMRGQARGVAVELGRTTRITIRLDPAAVITAKVLDRGTRQPVPWVCVAALARHFGGVEAGICGDDARQPTAESNEDGVVRIGELPAGTRSLFVMPQPGEYGIQWAGPFGGTGSQYAALKINAVPGRVAAVRPILLDPPGSLSGTVQDAGGGPATSTGVCASVMPWPEQGWPPSGACGIGEDGRFTLRNLGPYRWPIEFRDSSSYGVQWSGGASDRRTARTYRVKPGATADAGVQRLVQGHTLSGYITDPGGAPSTGGWVTVLVHNARTGDYVGSGEAYHGDYYSFGPVNGQPVKLRVATMTRGSFWFRSGRSFEEGDVVQVSPSGDTRQDIELPAAR